MTDFNEAMFNRRVEKWGARYKGVYFEIKKFISLSKEFERSWFTYYIHLEKKYMLSDEFNKFDVNQKTLLDWNYFDNKAINKLPLHGGCTFYKKEINSITNEYDIIIGCDYSHFEDEERRYELSSIVNDVKTCIDYFLECYTYKLYCIWCGKVLDREEAIPWHINDYVCSKCFVKDFNKNDK